MEINAMVCMKYNKKNKVFRGWVDLYLNRFANANVSVCILNYHQRNVNMLNLLNSIHIYAHF